MDWETIRRLRGAVAWLESENAKADRSALHAIDDATLDAMIARAAHYVANPLIRTEPSNAKSGFPNNVIPFRPSRKRSTKELVEQ